MRLMLAQALRATAWCFLLVVESTASAAAFSNLPPREVVLEPSVLEALASHLTGAGDADRRAFAWIALDEMANAYQAEVELAGKAFPATAKARSKLRRWQSSAGEFLAGLRSLQQGLDRVSAVMLRVDKMEGVILFLDANPVLISGPRIGKHQVWEQRIVENFCRRHQCPWLLESGYMASRDDTASGNWDLGQKHSPRFETTDGLSFEFASLADRASKERVCRAVISELRRLSKALLRAEDSIRLIDWQLSRLEPLPGTEDHRVILNRHGDYLRLSLPTLAQAGAFWGEFLPWLRAATGGTRYDLRFGRAERLLAAVGVGAG